MRVDADMSSPTEANILGASTAAALDQFTHGVVLLDHRGRIRFLNRLAQELVEADDGVAIREGLLVASSPKEATRLRDALRALVDTARGCSLRLRKTSQRRALTLLMCPLTLDTPRSASRRPASLIVITDPDSGCFAPKQRLMETYRLTAAEASMVMGLLKGDDLKQIADEKHISYETARTHLRRVLIKTGTHRQSDLVRLLIREVGILR